MIRLSLLLPALLAVACTAYEVPQLARDRNQVRVEVSRDPRIRTLELRSWMLVVPC